MFRPMYAQIAIKLILNKWRKKMIINGMNDHKEKKICINGYGEEYETGGPSKAKWWRYVIATLLFMSVVWLAVTIATIAQVGHSLGVERAF